MSKYRNVVIVVAVVEFIAAGLIAGAGAQAGDIGCKESAGKVEQSTGGQAASSPYAVCSDMPSACSP